MFDVITIGSATRDVIMKSEGFSLANSAESETGLVECFPFGSKINIDEIAFTTGGGATNSAVTFARQGLNVATVASVGKDAVAKEIIDELKNEGVDTGYFQTHDDDHTGFSAILAHKSGERTILAYKGEAQHLSGDKIPFDKLETSWFYITSLGGNIALLEKLAVFAKEMGAKLALNPGAGDLAHGPEKLKTVLDSADVLILNKEEAKMLIGGEGKEETISKLRAAAKNAILVLTDGRNGVMVETPGGKRYSAGVPDSPVIERTGAGDAFGSGFVSEYIRETRGKGQETSNEQQGTGEVIKKAIQFGTANASSVVTKFGAKEGILKKGDLGPWPLVGIESQ